MSLDPFFDLPPLERVDHANGITKGANSQPATQPSLTEKVARQSIPTLQTSRKRKRKVIDLTDPANASITQPVHLSPDELLSNWFAMSQPGLVREESIMLLESLRPSSPQEAQRKIDEKEKEMEETQGKIEDTQEKMKENRERMDALLLEIEIEKNQREINESNSSSLSIPLSSSSSSVGISPITSTEESEEVLQREALLEANKVLTQKIRNLDAEVSDLLNDAKIGASTFKKDPQAQKDMKETQNEIDALVLEIEKNQREIISSLLPHEMQNESISPSSSSSSSVRTSPITSTEESEEVLKKQALEEISNIKRAGVKNVLTQKIIDPDANINDLFKKYNIKIGFSTFYELQKKFIKNAPAHLKEFLRKKLFNNHSRH